MDYKLSQYIVMAPCPDESEKTILYSTRSGKIIVVKTTIIELIRDDKISLLPKNTIDKLVEIKALVPSGEDELRVIINENIEEIDTDDVLYEVIQPSSNCQLGCYYCGQKHEKGEISPILYESLITRIRSKVIDKKKSRMCISWFGGEPLMALKTMRELTVGLKNLADEFSLPYEASIVTNGLSLKLNVYKELVEQLGVNRIDVTLDGPEAYHDSHRYTKGGEGSFNIIFSNLMDILNSPTFDPSKCSVWIRCNVDQKNYEGVMPLIKLLAEKKLQKKIGFYPTGIYSWGNDAHLGSLTKEDFAKKEIVWLTEMVRLGFQQNLIPKRKKEVCMAVSKNSEMYDAKGNIFNCTEVSYVPKYEGSNYVLGNLKDTSPNKVSDRAFSNWNNEILSNQFPCHNCRILPICGGACPKSWHEDMRACPSGKYNIEDRLKIIYNQTKSKPE